MRLLSSPATASLAISVGGNTAGLAVRYHDVSFASTHHHCRFSACKGRRSVIQAAVMRSEIVKTAAGSRPRPAPWPRGTAPPTRVCFLVRVSLVFRRTQCFAETVWVKAANVAKHSHLGHLNLIFLLGVLLVATEGGLFYLKRSNLRNAHLRYNPVIDSLLAGAGPPWLRLGRRPLLPAV